MKRFGGENREALLRCIPFSKPQRIAGALYFGFELNGFVESEPESHRNPQLPANADTSLWFYEPKVPVDGRVRVFQMQFIGRRSECPMIYPPHVIIVDRVISSSLKAVSGYRR